MAAGLECGGAAGAVPRRARRRVAPLLGAALLAGAWHHLPRARLAELFLAPRRWALACLVAAPAAGIPESALAEERFNPLQLRGSFWETGQLYSRQAVEAAGPATVREAIQEVEASAVILRELQATAQSGDFETLRKQLRGDAFSEVKVRSLSKTIFQMLMMQDSTVEDESKLVAAQLAFDRFGQELDSLQKQVDMAAGGLGPVSLGRIVAAPVVIAANEVRKMSRDAADWSWDLNAVLSTTATRLDKFVALAREAAD